MEEYMLMLEAGENRVVQGGIAVLIGRIRLLSHAKLRSELCCKVFFNFLILPVLLPNFAVCIAASTHFCIDLTCGEVLIVVFSQLEFFEIIVLFEELVHLRFLLLVLNNGSGHLALGSLATLFGYA